MWHQEKPVTEKQGAAERGRYSFLLMLGFILIAWGTHVPVLGARLLPYSRAVGVTAAAATVVGVVFTIWARRVLAGNWSADVSFKEDQKLVTSGPYAITRHPIYTGLSLMIIGVALLQGTPAAALGAILAFISFQIKLEQEEKLMLRHYGAAYSGYQKRTRRIIPYLY